MVQINDITSYWKLLKIGIKGRFGKPDNTRK